MPRTIGRYAEIDHHPHPWRSRLRWWWTLIDHYRPHRRHPEDTGGGYILHREWGAWVVRPCRGVRQWRWVTPPVFHTRSIRGDDRDAAIAWCADQLGIP